MITPLQRAIATLVAAALVAPLGVSAQGTRPLLVETHLLKDPGGTQLLRVLKGTRVIVGATKGPWSEVTIDGWVPAAAMRDDKRDGFDVSVNLPNGTTVRDRPGDGTPMAGARFGALFDRIEVKGGWVHVKRTGWMPQASMVAAVVAPPPSGKPPVQSVSAPASATPPRTVASASTSVLAGSSLAVVAGGSPVASLESPMPVEVLEHRNGWAHVRVDAWVRDAALGNAPPPTGITAADIRAAPDKFVGQTVEWTVELLGIQKADELRPELPAGQPYLLARGPLPETGFVYIAIPATEEDAFRRLQPLARIRIRATVRAGRSRFLPTPVLNYIRRLD